MARPGTRRDLALATVVLSLGVALGVLQYRQAVPCWPWETTSEVAGGTFCDGRKARFDSD